MREEEGKKVGPPPRNGQDEMMMMMTTPIAQLSWMELLSHAIGKLEPFPPLLFSPLFSISSL